MTVSFVSAAQEELFNALILQLDALGYRGDLLERNYRFPDYLADDGVPEREVPAAAFGQTPVSYRTACFGVLLSGTDGKRGEELVRRYRALGAPLHFELHDDRVTPWVVGQDA